MYMTLYNEFNLKAKNKFYVQILNIILWKFVELNTKGVPYIYGKFMI